MQLPVALALSLFACIVAGVPVEKIHLAPSNEGTGAGIYQWQQMNLPSSFSVPNGVRGAAVAEVDGKVYFYGGESDEEYFYSTELNIFDTARQRWTAPATTGVQPPAVNWGSLVAVYEELWLIGGVVTDGTVDVYNTDIYALDLDTLEWRKVPSSKDHPTKKDEVGAYFWGTSGACAIFDSDNDTVYVIGGPRVDSPDEDYISVYRYDIETYAWTMVDGDGQDTVPALIGASCVVHNGKVGVFGGRTSDMDFSDDLFLFNLADYSWDLFDIVGNKPTKRAFAYGIHLSGARVLVAFGQNNDTYLDDVLVLDITKRKWNEVTRVGSDAPSGRFGFVPVSGNDGVFFFLGGATEDDTSAETWMLYEVCDKDQATLASGCQACPTGLWANYGDIICSKCTDSNNHESCKKYRAENAKEDKKHKKESKAWIAGVVIACVVVVVIIAIALYVLLRDKKKKDQNKQNDPEKGQKEPKKDASASSSSEGSESEELATSSSSEGGAAPPA